MRMFASLLAAAALAASASVSPAATTVIVADGTEAWCSAGDKLPSGDGCTATHTEYAAGRWARRHTHVGLPHVQESAPVHGWGTPPGVYAFSVPAGHTGTLSATVDFGWDQSVPGGAGNDVQLHVWADAARTQLVASTVGSGGNQPMASPHTLNLTLQPGSYWLQEDVFFGEHTWWMTNASLTVASNGGGGGY